MVAKLTISTLLLISAQLVLCQNLVPNPSFECGTDFCDYNIDPNQFSIYACRWTAPTRGCPDLFSTSLSASCFGGQPNSGFLQEQPGSQLPHTGKRFAGIFTYGNTTGAPLEYREYIATDLIQPLAVGSYYRASMYVSCASRMAFATNNLGMFFCAASDWIPTGSNEAQTFYQPQVVEKNVITSTQWVKVCTVFKATTPATLLVIGNFFDDSSTQAIARGGFSNDSYYASSYYYIDDVDVEEVPNPDSLTMIVSGSKTICQNQSTPLTVQQHFDKITWTTLADTTTVISLDSSFLAKPLSTITYHVEGKSCNITVRDTITVHVNPAPKISLGSDTTLCVGSVLLLDPGLGFSSYLWQDNSSSQSFTVNGPGKYSVTVKNQYGCSDQNFINISYLAAPSVYLGKDTVECSTIAPLNASNKRSSYLWSSGSTDSVFIPSNGGLYWVTVKNQCGNATDSVKIFSLNDVFIPNVVTDNGDGLNDQLRILGLGKNAGALKILNRWGEIIFFDERYNNSWPAAKPGLTEGTYYFLFQVVGCPDKKGWVQLLR